MCYAYSWVIYYLLLCSCLSDVELKLQTRVVGLQMDGDTSVSVRAEDGHTESFDCVILTMPTPQILDLEGLDTYLGVYKLVAMSGNSLTQPYSFGVISSQWYGISRQLLSANSV